MPAERRGGFGYWRDPVFLVCLGIYFVNREWIKPNLHAYSPLFHGHLNDTLLVPVALPIFLLVYRGLGLRPDDEPPRFWEMALHVLVWSIFFKWFGPSVLHRGVADVVDIGCFAGGGVGAWLMWRFRGRSATTCWRIIRAGRLIVKNSVILSLSKDQPPENYRR